MTGRYRRREPAPKMIPWEVLVATLALQVVAGWLGWQIARLLDWIGLFGEPPWYTAYPWGW